MSDAIIDFTKKRNEAIELKRREFERIMFRYFIGVYTVLEEDGEAVPVEIIDISDNGCLFQVPFVKTNGQKKYKKGHEVSFRIYFTKKSYLPVCANIKYSKDYRGIDGQTYLRYGCEFDTSPNSFEAIEKFIQFIYKFAEHCSTDKTMRGNHV